MRWIWCALLLSFLTPAIGSAQSHAPTISITTPDFSDPSAHPFFSTNDVTAVVTRATGSAGTLTVTVKVNAAAPVEADQVGTTSTYTAEDLSFQTQDPLVELNSTIVVTAVDSDFPGEPGTLTVTGTFDDQKPVGTISILTPPVVDGKTPFASVRIVGSMTDNDPNFSPRISLGFALLLPLPNADEINQRIPLSAGTNVIRLSATDRAQNTIADPTAPTHRLEITRTIVCQDPNFPVVPLPVGQTPITFTVDRFDDLPDPLPNDGICNVRPDSRGADDPFVPPPFNTNCTLRAAIQTANAHVGEDIIRLPAGVVVLRREGVAGDAEGDASGDLDVTENLRIVGAGRDGSIIDARKLKDRVFDVADGVELQLLRLTVGGGQTPTADDPSDAEAGGCVRSRGTLLANNVAFLACKSNGAGGAISLEPSLMDPDARGVLTCAIVARSQSKLDGGAIAVDGEPLVLRNSTVSLNASNTHGGALAAVTGEDPLELTLSNVTMSQNKAKLWGGAIQLGSGVTAKINNATFTKNTAKTAATLATTDGGEAQLSNSVIDDGKRACDPSAGTNVISKGGNVERDATCLPSPELSDHKNTDPKLDKLATNSGPPTHALKLGSPALDQAGTGDVACEPLDARDVERGDWPRNDNAPGSESKIPPFCDAGAFEREVTPLP